MQFELLVKKNHENLITIGIIADTKLCKKWENFFYNWILPSGHEMKSLGTMRYLTVRPKRFFRAIINEAKLQAELQKLPYLEKLRFALDQWRKVQAVMREENFI
jgi:hypothetical protein